MMSGDLQAVESRQVSEATQYKSLMQGGAARLGQTRLGAVTDSDLNNLWLQYGQNMYNSRKGVTAGTAEQAASSSQSLGAVYDYDYDYGDYSNVGGSLSGGQGLAGSRRLGLGGYGNIGLLDYTRGLGLGRQYGGSGLGVGYSGGGYSPVSVVSGYGPGVCEDKGLNPFLVLATVAGAALAFFVIYRQITTGGKRNLSPTANEFFEHFSSLVWSGE